MGKIRIIGKRRSGGRCAYCLDQLQESEAETCVGCGAGMHAACKQELGGCPSIGCKYATVRFRTPAPRNTRDVGEQVRLPHEAGRTSRQPPGWRVRFGPFARMLTRTGVWVALLLVTGALLVGAALNFESTWAALCETKSGGHSAFEGTFVGLGGIAFAGFILYSGINWLRRLPGVWSRVDRLLDDGYVMPARLRTYSTGSGKSTTWWAVLTPIGTGGAERRVDIAGIVTPSWIRNRSGQRVWVHGFEDPDETFVVEFEDGLLALLDPA